MPLSPLVESTLHAALLGGISNIMAQVISARQEEVRCNFGQLEREKHTDDGTLGGH